MLRLTLTPPLEGRPKAAAALREGRLDVIPAGGEAPDAEVLAAGVVARAEVTRLVAVKDKDRTRLARRAAPNALSPSEAPSRAAPRREAPPEPHAEGETGRVLEYARPHLVRSEATSSLHPRGVEQVTAAA